jgi:hypothetical protein
MARVAAVVAPQVGHGCPYTLGQLHADMPSCVCVS